MEALMVSAAQWSTFNALITIELKQFSTVSRRLAVTTFGLPSRV